MNEAIKLAIEKGGYRPYFKDSSIEDSINFILFDYEAPSHSEIICDPLFWQALSKALGWKEHLEHWGWNIYRMPADWRHYAHKYFDIKLTNGNEEEFWKGLIK